MSNSFPSFHDWLTGDEDRKRGYERAAFNYLDTFGMTSEASQIIRGHIEMADYDFSDNFDDDEINECAAEEFADSHGFETYSGYTRSELIHWAWNSNMDLTEFGPLEGPNIWDQIEHTIWYYIDGAARQALTMYAAKYHDAREEWQAEQED